jgi:phage FluMu protein Com
MIKFRCTYCRKLLGAEDKLLGKLTTCPKCKEKTRVEPAKAPPAKPAAGAKQGERLEVVNEAEEWEIVEEVEDLEVVEEAVDVDLADFEEEEEGRPRRRPRKPVEEEDDEEEERPLRKSRRPVDEEEEDRPHRKPRRPVDEQDEEEDDEDDLPRRRPRRPVDEQEEEEDDRPRRKSGKGKRGRRREEPKPFLTRNRVMGILGIILGVFAPIGGVIGYLLVSDFALLYLIVGIVMSLLFLGAGVVYLIIG